MDTGVPTAAARTGVDVRSRSGGRAAAGLALSVLLIGTAVTAASAPAMASSVVKVPVEVVLEPDVVQPSTGYGNSFDVADDAVVIGASSIGPDGVVYVADIDSDGLTIQRRLPVPAAAIGNRFGLGVATDGLRLLAGYLGPACPGTTTGRNGAFAVFERRNGDWIHTADIAPPPGIYPCGNGWESALDVAADTIVTGSHYGIRIYEYHDGSWVNTWYDAYIDGVATRPVFSLSDDGRRLALQRADSTVAVLDKQPDGTWASTAILSAPGVSTASHRRPIDIEGNRIAIGANTANLDDDSVLEGAAYVHTQAADGTWSARRYIGRNQSATASTAFGADVALLGNSLYVSAQAIRPGVILQYDLASGAEIAEYSDSDFEGAATGLAVGAQRVLSWSVYASNGAYNRGAIKAYKAHNADSTAPVVTAVPDRAPNLAGWYASPVTVDWAVTDATPSSGVVSWPEPTVADREGTAVLYESGAACDAAGNCARGSTTISLDRTPPSVGAPTFTLNPKVVTESTVVTAPVADDLSGVAAAEFFLGSDPGPGYGTPMMIDVGVATANIDHALSPGVYTLSVRCQDLAGNWSTVASEYLVVYDADGGYVTGGGHVDSPAGAYLLNPLSSGRANFGFVSKYQRGATVPTGNTQFRFQAGDLNFSSTSYEWLVVSGAKAQYKGEGTINGASGYRFLLTATDGQLNGGTEADRFRIKIWNGLGTVYDNMAGSDDDMSNSVAITGGSIIVHK